MISAYLHQYRNHYDRILLTLFASLASLLELHIHLLPALLLVPVDKIEDNDPCPLQTVTKQQCKLPGISLNSCC